MTEKHVTFAPSAVTGLSTILEVQESSPSSCGSQDEEGELWNTEGDSLFDEQVRQRNHFTGSGIYILIRWLKSFLQRPKIMSPL
jgi:hypothetical protein